MKIKVIGCGNAFSNLNYNQCFLIEEETDGKKHRMLFDCGFQIGAALFKAGIDLRSIDDVFISHAHADHIGFLEGLAFQRYDWINKPHFATEKSPRLITNQKLMLDLWNESLKGGLKSIEGMDATLWTFFRNGGVEPNETFTWADRWEGKLIQQIHIMTGTIISSTFGLFMTDKLSKTKVYFTADTQHCSPRQVEIFYKDADIIFQDCECIGVDTKEKKLKFMSNVHANYGQLAGWESANSHKLSTEIKAKMWLSHYQDFVTEGKDNFGNECDWDGLAAADGFKGFVKVGQEIIV